VGVIVKTVAIYNLLPFSSNGIFEMVPNIIQFEIAPVFTIIILFIAERQIQFMHSDTLYAKTNFCNIGLLPALHERSF
jgi:hypothetical protein